MPQSTNPSGASNEIIVPTTVSYDETNGAKSTSTPTVQETTSTRQNAWPWQGGPPGWTPGAGPWSGPWGGSPTTVITVTTTVAYTQPSSTTTVFQPSSSGPAEPEARKDGVNISAPVVAGIGAGAGIGLLGIGVLVAYLFTRRSNRRRHQSSSRQALSNVGSTSDLTRPPYPFSASNESPVELVATREPQEMCASTKPTEIDAPARW